MYTIILVMASIFTTRQTAMSRTVMYTMVSVAIVRESISITLEIPTSKTVLYTIRIIAESMSITPQTAILQTATHMIIWDTMTILGGLDLVFNSVILWIATLRTVIPPIIIVVSSSTNLQTVC